MSGTRPASYSSPVDFRIGQTPPGVANFNEAQNAVADIYASLQQMIHTFIDIGGIGPQPAALWEALNGSTRGLTEGNTRRLICRASQTLLFGNIISLHIGSDGKIQSRLAAATSATLVADGFCSQPGGIIGGQLGEVILGAGVVLLNGIVVGQRYWLAPTPGLIIDAPPVAAGQVEQYLGIGIDTTHLWFQCGMWLQH